MMNKVAIITGASQGIGAGLVTAYRKLGYSVVGTSRSIGDSYDPEVLTVRGDVAELGVGVVRTPMHAPETHDSLAALHPLGRLGEISDVVDAIVYLENAAFVTGEILHVDGGQSAGH